MNQILSTSVPQGNKGKDKKRKRSGGGAPAQIQSVVKFFAICLLFFGFFLIGTGSYAIYQDSTSEAKIEVKPNITLELESEDTILLKVVSEKDINEISYNWEGQEETTIDGDAKKYIEQKIYIPGGTNKLTVKATDVDGGVTEYSQSYTLESKIQIEALENGNVKISYEGDEQISYMTYRWDEEDETTVNINNTVIEQEIEVRRGTHTLTVVVVDVNNKTETKVQEIQGVAKPKIDISMNADYTAYVIKVTDDVGLSEVIVTLNEDENERFGEKLTGKEFQFEIPLQSGSDNKMDVVVTNTDGLSENAKVMFHKD